MNEYVYHWTFRPEAGLEFELHVNAPSVSVARRELLRFLIDHDGTAWRIDHVRREIVRDRNKVFGRPNGSRSRSH